MATNEKIDLSNTTFIIPIKVDSPERRENLFFNLTYLLHHFKTKIIVIEESDKSTLRWELFGWGNVKYIHVKNYFSFTHKTKLFNLGMRVADTQVVALHDVDVFMKPEQYREAASICSAGLALMVFPFDGNFYNIPREWIYKIAESNMDCSMLENQVFESMGIESPGGSVFINRLAYLEIGGDNENFRSWGWEDNERVVRCKNLGLAVTRIQNPIYHIDHPRGVNSLPHNRFYEWNKAEHDKIACMPKDTIQRYIATWPWRLNMQTWWDKQDPEIIRTRSGGKDSQSRISVRTRIANRGYRSLLDLGSGFSEDPSGYLDSGYHIEYTGVEICQNLVSRARELGYYVINSDIRSVPLGNEYAECSILRNILELLPDYKDALAEAIRLSSKEVIVSFSVFPHIMNGMGDIIKEVEPGLYRNSYSQDSIEKFLMTQSRVKSYFWEKLDDHNMMLAIILN